MRPDILFVHLYICALYTCALYTCALYTCALYTCALSPSLSGLCEGGFLVMQVKGAQHAFKVMSANLLCAHVRGGWRHASSLTEHAAVSDTLLFPENFFTL
jgi:hypothetical protein